MILVEIQVLFGWNKMWFLLIEVYTSQVEHVRRPETKIRGFRGWITADDGRCWVHLLVDSDLAIPYCVIFKEQIKEKYVGVIEDVNRGDLID